MNIFAEQETKIKTVDLELTCRLDDTQLFYQNSLIEYVEESATRHIAMLYILSNQGYELASALLKQNDDVDILSGLFLQYRELEAKSRSLSCVTAAALASVGKQRREPALTFTFMRGSKPKLNPPLSGENRV